MSLSPDQLALLSQCFLLREVPPEQLPALTDDLTAERCAAGELIYTRTRFRKAVGVVLEGRLSVLKGEELLLKTIGPGQCFGAAALFCPAEDYVTTVQAETAALLVFLPHQWLVHLFETYPKASVAYIAFLSQRIRFLNRKIDSFTAPSAQEALCRHLLAIQQDGVARISGGYSQLARSLNMGRASLYRALDALEAEGRIRRDGKAIRLLPYPEQMPTSPEGAEKTER